MNTTALQAINGNISFQNAALAAMNAEADSIQSRLDRRVDIDGPALPFRLEELDAMLARAGDLHARAKTMREQARTIVCEENADELAKMKATESNRILASAMMEFTVTEERMSILYRTLDQACKVCITQISFVKKQMEMR